jgi:hypothetical protein
LQRVGVDVAAKVGVVASVGVAMFVAVRLGVAVAVIVGSGAKLALPSVSNGERLPASSVTTMAKCRVPPAN